MEWASGLAIDEPRTGAHTVPCRAGREGRIAMGKPNPVSKMQADAARGWKRDDNLRRFGSLYPPGEVRRSLIALGIMLVMAAVALIAFVR